MLFKHVLGIDVDFAVADVGSKKIEKLCTCTTYYGILLSLIILMIKSILADTLCTSYGTNSIIGTIISTHISPAPHKFCFYEHY